MKKASVIPVPKKAKSVSVEDFRPISIQVTLSKIYEMVLLNEIQNFTDKNDIFAEIQYGFRRRVSSITLLRNVNRLIRNNLNISELSIFYYINNFQKLIFNFLLN